MANPDLVLLFDVGGVLAVDMIEDKCRDLTGRYGLPEGRLVELSGPLRPRADLGELSDAQFWFELLRQAGVDPKDGDEEIVSFLAPVPGTLDLVERLRVRHRVAILSNDSIGMARSRRDRFGFDAIFDPILISAEFGIIKPDPRIYDLAIERICVEPERVVFIDNTPENVSAARKRGLQGIVFRDADQLEVDLAALGLEIG